jgi:hypothetical protein
MAMNNGWKTRIEATGYNFGGESHIFNGVTRKIDTGLRTVSIGLSRSF